MNELENISLLVDKIISYENTDNLSWIRVYKKLLKELNLVDSNSLLSNTVKELTNRGYDIIDEPFRLESFR